MSSKKKAKPARTIAVGPGQAGSLDSGGLAGAALAAARYKDAIELFKDLLKRDRRPAWLDGLAAAYAGRAEQLAAKDMLKEALALWRTRAETCQLPLLDGPYVGWLMKSGQIEQALRLLRPWTRCRRRCASRPPRNSRLPCSWRRIICWPACCPRCRASAPRPARRLPFVHRAACRAIRRHWSPPCRASRFAPPTATCARC